MLESLLQKTERNNWSDDLFLMLLRQAQIQRIDENPLTESCILRFQCMLNWLHYITVESRENFTVERYSRRQVFTSLQSQMGIESKTEFANKLYLPNNPLPPTRIYFQMLPSTSNNVTEIWIHGWISVLIAFKSSWTNHFSGSVSQAEDQPFNS